MGAAGFSATAGLLHLSPVAQSVLRHRDLPAPSPCPDINLSKWVFPAGLSVVLIMVHFLPEGENIPWRNSALDWGWGAEDCEGGSCDCVCRMCAWCPLVTLRRTPEYARTFWIVLVTPGDLFHWVASGSVSLTWTKGFTQKPRAQTGHHI